MFVAVPPECCLQPNNALQFFTGEGALPGDGGAWHRGAELRVYSRVQGLWGSGLSRAGLIGLWAAVGASLGMLQCSRVLLPKYRHDLGLLRSMIVHCYQVRSRDGDSPLEKAMSALSAMHRSCHVKFNSKSPPILDPMHPNILQHAPTVCWDGKTSRGRRRADPKPRNLDAYRQGSVSSRTLKTCSHGCMQLGSWLPEQIFLERYLNPELRWPYAMRP